jgi:hypothetical protein
MENNETRKGYPVPDTQDSQKDNQVENVPSNVIVPYEGILPKNRMFGRIEGHLEHNQIVGWNVLLYSAYLDLLKNPNQYKFSISIRDFCDLARIDYKNYYSHLFYKEGEKQKSLETLLKGLGQTIYRVEWRENGEVYAVLNAALLSAFKMDKKTGMIYFEFPSIFRDNLLVSGDFYFLYIPVLGELKGSYAPLLYEQILQRRGLPEWRVRAEELKEILGVEDNEYKNTWDFHRWVLYPAIKIINKVTEIDLKVSKLKQGRSIIGYRFTWDNNAFEKIYKKYHIPKLEVKEEIPSEDLSDELDPKPIKIVNTKKTKPKQSISQPEPDIQSQPISEPEINSLVEILPENLKDIKFVKRLLSKNNFDDVKDAILCALEHKPNNITAYISTLLENPEINLFEFRAKRIEQEQKQRQKQEQERKAREQEEREKREQAIMVWWDQKIKEYISKMSGTERKALEDKAKEIVKSESPKIINSELFDIFVDVKKRAIVKQKLESEGIKPPEKI